MSNETLNQFNAQFEKLFVGPARTYASLLVDHTEQLVKTQLEATKAYADVGLKQYRAALDIKDQKDLQSYVEGQQKLAQELGERVKGDAEKVVNLNQEFVQKAQKVAEDTTKSAAKTARAK